jgi:hypothetical protein
MGVFGLADVAPVEVDTVEVAETARDVEDDEELDSCVVDPAPEEE